MIPGAVKVSVLDPCAPPAFAEQDAALPAKLTCRCAAHECKRVHHRTLPALGRIPLAPHPKILLLPNIASSKISRRPCHLQIISSGQCIHIQHLSGKIQSGNLFRFHGTCLHILYRHTALGDDGLVETT